MALKSQPENEAKPSRPRPKFGLEASLAVRPQQLCLFQSASVTCSLITRWKMANSGALKDMASLPLPCKSVCVSLESAFFRSVLILKCFHSRDYRVLKLAFCTCLRPLLEFSSQVWSPHYKYLIDKLEFVQRFFTRKLSGLSELSYFSRLKIAWFRIAGMSPTNLRPGAIL